ncbi:MAG: HAMP domain-containing histidine kinase [Burkholderiales bacterium]|nr:HAMP domain-containing histidine kinase [Burkholderiales bacterium]
MSLAPRAPVASFRLRILFRGVFALLAAATILLAVVLLQDEKERSYRSYQKDLRKTQSEIMARLRQPSGMLALLNPNVSGMPPLQPLVLPFGALDFDDPNRVHQAVDQAGCSVRYPDDSTLCVAVGGTPAAAGFLYAVGSFVSPELSRSDANPFDTEAMHRTIVRMQVGEQAHTWLALFERLSAAGEPLVRGRILAFDTTVDGDAASAQPLRDFRGGLWQSPACAGSGVPPDCLRRVFYAMRLPVKALRVPNPKQRAAWPPPILDRMRVHLTILAPGHGPALFDSDAQGAEPPASLEQAVQALRPGETLAVARQDLREPVLSLKGRDPEADRRSPLLLLLVNELPVTLPSAPVELREMLVTPAGSYEVRLAGDARTIDPGLGAIATRISWYVGAMLTAIALAWLVMEVGLIRRITDLSSRAAAVSKGVRKGASSGERIVQLEVSDLRGPDELGILAGGLADLLQRVKDDVEREEMRARQEREMLEAVGHEILSPLQSLMVLFPDASEPAHRYVQRMLQAVGVLYGQASPREALKAARLELMPVDLDKFLFHVASNARFAGIEGVRYEPLGRPAIVRVDEFRLEDVITHVLRNADRHRTPGSEITLSLAIHDGNRALMRIHNAGRPIQEGLLGRMFEYGVRDPDGDGEAQGRRGQGLFVARTYMAKMGGSVRASNEEGGVALYLELPCEGA